MAINFAKFFRNLFGMHTPTPPTTVPPSSAPSLRAVAVWTVPGASVALDDTTGKHTGTTNQDGYFAFDNIPNSLTATSLWVTADGYEDYAQHVDLVPGNRDLVVGPHGDLRDYQTQLPGLVSKHHVRKGMVHVFGRSFVDDDGLFYPLGATLFWALRGWKFEQARIKANLDYVAKFNYDFVRILCHVEWGTDGQDGIDYRWPEFEQILGEFLDYAYSIGLRTELTLLGTLSDKVNRLELCDKVTRVIASRPQMVLDLEMANEYYQNGINGNLALLTEMSTHLRAAGVTNLIALSSGEQGSIPFDQVLAGKMITAGANLQTIHMDRGTGDEGWRFCRQPWDFRDCTFATSHNEPIGPRSSVAESTDPVELAHLRATGIICGVGAFVLHNGVGVAGQVDPAHNRPANLWEVPGIDGIMQAVRNVDLCLPDRAADGRKWNNQWAGHPCPADSIWPDTATGVNRQYMNEFGWGFVSVLNGIKDHVGLVAARPVHIDAYDATTGAIVTSFTLQPGQKQMLTGRGYILRGTYV